MAGISSSDADRRGRVESRLRDATVGKHAWPGDVNFECNAGKISSRQQTDSDSPTMPVLLEGSCHCRAVKYTVESNTPVPFMLCQCSICRKVGGYMGSVNVMGNSKTLNIIRGKDTIKVYIAPTAFNKDDSVKTAGTSKRSFCSECSSMLWNYHDEWPHWIYPFASTIDAPNPLPPLPKGQHLVAIKRDSCPSHVPLPVGAKAYQSYGPSAGIEAWHKETGAWVD